VAQTPDSSNQSWSSSSDEQDAPVGSRTRKTESHTTDGNRTIDKLSVQILRSGSYEPYQDIERESVKVNANTTRTIVRSYGRDSDGRRVLTQTTEEETQALPDGSGKVVRSTSNPDANGRLQVVQREVQETKKLSPTLQETSATVMLPNSNGGLTPQMKTQERKERTGEHTVQVQKSTMLPDPEGRWQTEEVKQSTITDDGKNRSSDEHVLRSDGGGPLAEVSRTVSKESEDGT